MPDLAHSLPHRPAGRTGRPPVYPNTVERHRLQQRRLSFSGTDPLASAAAAAAAAARPSASGQRRVAGSSTPLDKLSRHLDSAAQQEREQQQQAQQQAHPAQAALAASLADAGEFEFGGAERLMCQEDADLLASMPEHLRRMSTDGIISLDTLRVCTDRQRAAWWLVLFDGWWRKTGE